MLGCLRSTRARNTRGSSRRSLASGYSEAMADLRRLWPRGCRTSSSLAENDWPKLCTRGRLGAVATHARLFLKGKKGKSKGQSVVPAVGCRKAKGGSGKARGDGASNVVDTRVLRLSQGWRSFRRGAAWSLPEHLYALGHQRTAAELYSFWIAHPLLALKRPRPRCSRARKVAAHARHHWTGKYRFPAE